MKVKIFQINLILILLKAGIKKRNIKIYLNRKMIQTKIQKKLLN
jgi:hypothetical protein